MVARNLVVVVDRSLVVVDLGSHLKVGLDIHLEERLDSLLVHLDNLLVVVLGNHLVVVVHILVDLGSLKVDLLDILMVEHLDNLKEDLLDNLKVEHLDILTVDRLDSLVVGHLDILVVVIDLGIHLELLGILEEEHLGILEEVVVILGIPLVVPLVVVALGILLEHLVVDILKVHLGQPELALPLLVAVVAITFFASPCFAFAFQAFVGQLDQVDWHLDPRLECIEFLP